MGCGASSESEKKPAGSKEKEAASPYATAHDGASSVASLTASEQELYQWVDKRTVSAFESASEPSRANHKARLESVAARGRAHGCNSDPEQYLTTNDGPEFKKADRRRVSDWIRETAQAMYATGAEPIPGSGWEVVAQRRQSSTFLSPEANHDSGSSYDPLSPNQESQGRSHDVASNFNTTWGGSLDSPRVALEKYQSAKFDPAPGPGTPPPVTLPGTPKEEHVPTLTVTGAEASAEFSR